MVEHCRDFRRVKAVLGGCVVAGISVAYCLPHHPSVHRTLGDGAAHVALFLGMAALLVPIRHPAWTFSVLAVLGAMLEVIQWHEGGFTHLEWNDVISNELGVGLAVLVIFLRQRYLGKVRGAPRSSMTFR